MKNQKKETQETLSQDIKTLSQDINTLYPKNVNPLNPENIYSDVLGSYTGVTEDGDMPVQDADDL